MNQKNISPEEMIQILKDRDFKLASDFIQIGSILGCIPAIRYATAHKTWKCVYSKQKPKRVLYTIECNESRWSIKANLFHIDQYRKDVESCSDNIKRTIESAYNCKMCSSHCKGGTVFTLDGEQYKKCIGCCFYFKNLHDEDWYSVQTLIQKEFAY